MLQTLLTPAGEHLPDVPWQVYPRPQFRRDRWLNLNGWWDFAVTEGDAPPARFPGKIRLPFCPESVLSGVGQHFAEGSALWYRRTVTLPDDWAGAQLALHIGAADQVLDAWVNGMAVGSHTGGYEAMTFGVTGAWRPGTNEILLRVRDDLRSTVLPYGKQVQQRGGMWYTPVSGIWQTVWLEPLPPHTLPGLTVTVDNTRAILDTGDATQQGTVTVHTPDGPLTVPLQNGRAEIRPARPRLWCPADPYLYECTVQTPTDRVESYFALRKLTIQKAGGHPRLCLNGRPVFFHGVLDQGYFSDGLFTPAAPDCYEQDIRMLQRLGFNTLRKHIKVEPDYFYYLCDKLGMVVFQDMVNNGDYAYWRDTVWPTLWVQRLPDRHMHKDPATRAAFLDGMRATVRQLYNHPCVCYWTIFNEGWGQFDATAVYRKLRALDSSRFIDATSGWFRGGKTDVDSRHIYYGPWVLRAGKRPLVLSEFGGCCLAVDGHRANPDKSYGYSTATDRAALQQAITGLYRQKVLPAVRRGLCAAIYTQLSDVEDEINGLVTYDRRVVKPDAAAMGAMADELQAAFAASCAGKSH